jgi:hypothetical protein
MSLGTELILELIFHIRRGSDFPCSGNDGLLDGIKWLAMDG